MNSIEDAIQRDAKDPFQSLIHLFNMPVDEQGQLAIYLNGNSLGPKPKSIDQALIKECHQWGDLGARGHFDQEHPWLSYNELVTNSLSRLAGSKPEEVVAMGTLTANLHVVLASFYRPTRNRFKIIRLAGFSSDTYAIASQVKQRLETISDFTEKKPFTLDEAIIEIKANENGYIEFDTFKKVLEEHGDSTSIIWLEAVHYLTGQYFNIPEITHIAHRKGCKIGLDLAHAIGNIPLSLHEWEVDFAVWCSYKYLSAGPGAIAGLYVHEKYLADPKVLRFAGWWGHNKSTRFQMPSIFDATPTAESWQMSNPGIFLLTALRESLSIFDKVDLHALREKNKRLVSYVEQLIHSELSHDIQIITPKNPDERGCQLSFFIKHTSPPHKIEKIFFNHSIICDVRGNVVRIAPMGLYTSFKDLYHFVSKLKLICHELKSSSF
jgi:kynureninase